MLQNYLKCGRTKYGFVGYKKMLMLRLQCIAFLLLAFAGVWLLALAAAAPVHCGMGMALAIAPIALVAKMKKKAEEQDNPLTDEELKLLQSMEDVFADFAKGVIDEDTLTSRITEISDEIKKLISDSSAKITEMEETIKSISKEVKEMRGKGITFGGGSIIEKAVDALLEHQKVKDFLAGNVKKSGRIRLKDIVSMEGWDGRILLAQNSERIEQLAADRRINIRDTMLVDTGDPAFPAITYAQVRELNRNAAAVSENGRLPESSFKVKEVTDEVKRIGTYITISKRLLKSRTYLRSYLINRLPRWVKMSEDFQILFGDGNGENLHGIAKRALNITAWLTGTITGAAGMVKAVSSYDGGAQTLVTFSKEFTDIQEGMEVQFGNAPTGSVLLQKNLLHKVNDTTIVVNVPFTALTAAQIDALTFTIHNNFAKLVDTPTIADAVDAVFAALTYGEYSPNMIALNPSTVFEINAAKDSTGRPLNIIVVNNGVKSIAGRVIVETTAVPPGYFFAGDMQNGTSLVDYTSLEVEFAEDVESRLTNTVTVIAQEEVILQVFNPFACAYGKLSEVVAAITA